MIVSCDGMSGRRQVCRADKTQFWAHMDEIHSRCYNSTLAPYQCGQALCSGERNRLEIRREQLSNMTSQLFASSLDKISARRTKVHKKKNRIGLLVIPSRLTLFDDVKIGPKVMHIYIAAMEWSTATICKTGHDCHEHFISPLPLNSVPKLFC